MILNSIRNLVVLIAVESVPNFRIKFDPYWASRIFSHIKSLSKGYYNFSDLYYDSHKDVAMPMS